jgi:hypothetical protein
MRELAGVIFAIKKCFHKLQRRKFTIFTDHSALVWLFNACTTDHQLQRWADILMTLDFQVVHFRGIHNTRPDALSRLQIAPISSIDRIELSNHQILKDKKCPATAEEKLEMFKVAHENGNFGQQSILMQIWHNVYW